MKILLKFAQSVIAALICVLICSCSEKNQEPSGDYSMFYRDTLNLAALFPEDIYPRTSYDLWADKQQVIIENDRLYIDNPETLTPSMLSFKIGATETKTGETIYKKVCVRCWIDDVIVLEEEEISDFTSVYKPALERRFLKAGYAVPVLLTQNDTTYYSDGEKLLWRTKESKGVCAEEFKTRDSKYNQMIKDGSIAFIRTGKYLYYSEDNLAHWNIIYQGKQGMKESMVWNAKDSTLIFCEYTPGDPRPRHHLLNYNIHKATVDTVLTFYSKAEHDNKNLSPFCRHHHVLSLDPYTNDIYLGTGDLDDESKIMRSTDGGKTFKEVGSGSQVWRTLTLMYTSQYIYWGTDSSSPQYLSRLDRNRLNDSLSVSTDSLGKYPLINSALWFAVPYKDMYIMCSNNEGCLYDKNHRIYALTFAEDGTPTAFCCNAEAMDKSVYDQLCLIGFDCEDYLWVCGDKHSQYRKFKVIDKRGK